MMGERRVMQEALFYGFSLDRHVPDNHMLRRIDCFVDLSEVRGHCHVNSNWPREVRTTQFEFMRLSQLATSVKLLLGRRGACGGM